MTRYHFKLDSEKEQLLVFDSEEEKWISSPVGVKAFFPKRFFRKFVLVGFQGEVCVYNFLAGEVSVFLKRGPLSDGEEVRDIIEYSKKEILVKTDSRSSVWNISSGQFLFNLPTFTGYHIREGMFACWCRGWISFYFLETGALFQTLLTPTSYLADPFFTGWVFSSADLQFLALGSAHQLVFPARFIFLLQTYKRVIKKMLAPYLVQPKLLERSVHFLLTELSHRLPQETPY